LPLRDAFVALFFVTLDCLSTRRPGCLPGIWW
jgi:hypothetical protein